MSILIIKFLKEYLQDICVEEVAYPHSQGTLKRNESVLSNYNCKIYYNNFIKAAVVSRSISEVFK